MASVPTDEQILDAVRAIYSSAPDLGRAKILAKLKTDNDWTLSDNRLKKLLDANDLKRTAEPSKKSIELPANALAAQERYKDDSTRCFKLYGKGDHDWGVTPNTDMQMLIGICHDRLVKRGAPGPWSPTVERSVASSDELRTIWNYYWAAGEKVGLTKDDVGRQLKAEYGADPTPYIPELTKEDIEHRKAVFKKNSMKMKRAMLKEPEGRKVIPVDARGEPIWDEEKHGEYTVLVTKINKGDGLTEDETYSYVKGRGLVPWRPQQRI